MYFTTLWSLWESLSRAHVLNNNVFYDTFESSGRPSSAHMLKNTVFYDTFKGSGKPSEAHMLKNTVFYNTFKGSGKPSGAHVLKNTVFYDTFEALGCPKPPEGPRDLYIYIYSFLLPRTRLAPHMIRVRRSSKI